MILAAGLSPAWQQIMLFDSFSNGEVNRAREVHWCASGKVLNTGMALHSLGGESKTLALIGGNSGAAIQQEFRERGTPARWVQSLSPTRVCTTILDVTTGMTTELVENSARANTAELQEFQRAFFEEATEAEMVVLSGSLPQGTPEAFYQDLMSQVNVPVVLDIRGAELLATLECQPLLVKPNREELEKTLGCTFERDDELLDGMREINRRGAQWVLVTEGKKSVWLTSPEETFRFVPPTAKVVNPIGCGDCLAAGVAWSLCQKSTVADAVRLGMAAAADNISQLLPARLDRHRVESLAKTIEVGNTSTE